jgi:hypothetical protein
MKLVTRVAVMDHLRFFADGIGPRPVGSAPYHEAGEYIRRAFRDAGLHDAGLRVDEIQYDCVDWHHRQTTLELNGERLPVAGNVYSPACDVTGPTLALCTPAELEAADLAGKIALFSGDLSGAPLIPMNCPVYNTERDQRINQILSERPPLAVIGVNLKPPAVDSLIEDADQMVPSATVPAEVGMRLLDHEGERVHLRIDAERKAGRAATIIGQTDPPTPARITLMAHYDTKIDTPGAVDNGGGIAALLALAEILCAEDLPLGLEFIAFGDEEYYANSDALYVEQRGEQMKDILLAINMDGIGQRLGANNVALMTASEELKEALEEVVNDYPGVVWTAPWPQSNHSTFAWRGVPSVALSSNGVMSHLHQPSDTVELVSEEKLAEVVSLVGAIVQAVQDKPVAWARE